MKKFNRTPLQGFSLVEMMVAITISLILLAGVIQVFAASKQTYNTQESLLRMQEDGRFLLDFLTKDIRIAGYSGCSSKGANMLNTLNITDPTLYNFTDGVDGDEATGTNGADRLYIRGAIGIPLNVTQHNQPSADLKVMPTNPPQLADNDIVVITDCINAAIFQITNYTAANGNTVHNTGVGTPGNATKDLGKSYEDNGFVQRMTTRQYFIAPGASGAPALWRQEGTAAAQELADNVENMQILFLEDVNGDGDTLRYVHPTDVDPTKVIAVRVSLLLRTREQVAATTDTLKYDLLGTPDDVSDDYAAATTDKRVRRVFSVVAKLRNRGV